MIRVYINVRDLYNDSLWFRVSLVVATLSLLLIAKASIEPSSTASPTTAASQPATAQLPNLPSQTTLDLTPQQRQLIQDGVSTMTPQQRQNYGQFLQQLTSP